MTEAPIIPTDKRFRDECDRIPWPDCCATHDRKRDEECAGCPAWEGLKRRNAERTAKETP